MNGVAACLAPDLRPPQVAGDRVEHSRVRATRHAPRSPRARRHRCPRPRGGGEPVSFDPIADIMERDNVDEQEAIRRYAVEAANPEHKVCEVPDCPGFGVAHPPLPVDHASVKQSIERDFERVVKAALDEVERLARLVLMHNAALEEFIMAMGGAFFTIVTGDGVALSTSVPVEECVGADTLDSFLVDWDEFLHLTGHPMRFTATGEKVTKW